MGNWQAEKEELWQVVQEMWKLGLVSGAGGNAKALIVD